MSDQTEPYPVEENYEYLLFVKYLQTKKSPNAKRLLSLLKSMKTTDEYLDFKTYLLFDIFTESF